MNDLRRRIQPASPGFTLIELLIAMGIFTVGAIAIAAPMLAAARMQSKTVDSILAKQGDRNAEALLRARPLMYEPPAAGPDGTRPYFTNNNDNDAPQADMTVYPFSKKSLGKWSLRDRIIGGEMADGRDGRYLWVPLIRSTKRVSTQSGDSLVLDKTQWQIYVFLLRIDRDGNYGEKRERYWANRDDPAWVPGVRTMKVSIDPDNRRKFHIGGGVSNDADGDGRPDLLRSGDKILDRYGRDYAVKEILDAKTFLVSTEASAAAAADQNLVVWYAPPEHAAAPSPVRSIRLLEGGVTKPKI